MVVRWTGPRDAVRVGLCFGLLWFGCQGAAAQSQDRRETLEALTREREQLLRENQNRQAPLWAGASATPWLAPVANESPCFDIRHFELIGDPAPGRLDGFGWLVSDLGAFENGCLGPQSLALLVRNLDARLVDRGYVTSSVSLPPQNLTEGRLRLQLLLGRVARIDLRGGAQAVSPNALALRVGDVLNLRDIEQTLENLARLPSQAAQFQIEPAEGADGSVLAIATAAGVEPGGGNGSGVRRWRVSLGADNAAAREYGAWQANAQAVLDAPLGLSDQVSLNLSQTLSGQDAGRRQTVASVYYSLPVGRHLLSISANRASHAQPVQGLTTRFSENGFDASLQARWQWTAWRSASARWAVWGGATQRHLRNHIDDVELVLQRRKLLTADAGLSAWMRWPAGELSLEAEHNRSVHVRPDSDVDLAAPPLARTQRLALTWQQSMVLGAGRRSGQYANPAQYEARLSWAAVNDPASAADLQSLGSRWSVRGFDARAVLTGREQTSLRQDLRLPASTVGALRLLPTVGLDAGRVAHAASPAGRTLVGAALGLRWAAAGWASGELTLAAPLHKPAGFAASSAVIYASFSFSH